MSGLLNVGTEEHKGRAELKEAYGLIAENAAQANYDFVGFVEGSDIPGDAADVIVTDGFTGNVAIKTGEGTASLMRTACCARRSSTRSCRRLPRFWR